MVVGEFFVEVDLLVIGGGPGGYTAAIRAAQLGKEVVLIEKADLGGVCLNQGCIPSKSLISIADDFYKIQHSQNRGLSVENSLIDLKAFQEWKNNIVINKLSNGIKTLCTKNNVNVYKGEAYFTNSHEIRVISEFSTQRIIFKNCIIATGTKPAELPSLPFSSKIISSSEALSLTQLPKKLVVVGGGYIGIELGTAFSKMGSNVIILEASDDILMGFDKETVNIIERNLRKFGATVYTNANVISGENDEKGVIIRAQINNEIVNFEADYCLVTVGRKPNTSDINIKQIGIELTESGHVVVDKQCRTSLPHIFAIGDIVTGPALAHKASYEGKIAAEVISGLQSEVDYRVIPLVVFSDPEIATVGLSDIKAKELGFQVKTGTFPFAVNGRALSSDEVEGFVKIVADVEDNCVLGVQIVGSQASNLISGAALAIELGTKVEDISLTVHPHPTFGEAILEACDVVLKKAIHLINN